VLTAERLATLLADYVRQNASPVDLLLMGSLGAQAYGDARRCTPGVAAEVAGDLEGLAGFLRAHQIPADLGEDLSRWSVVAMPPGYRERARVWMEGPGFRIRVLHPTDFVIAKLRRGTAEDLDDAAFVAARFGVTVTAVEAAAEAAVAASPKDTALFLFRKTVEQFSARVQMGTSG
jgi:hypothetical protein